MIWQKFYFLMKLSNALSMEVRQLGLRIDIKHCCCVLGVLPDRGATSETG